MSIQGDDGREMTHSPATSYTSGSVCNDEYEEPISDPSSDSSASVYLRSSQKIYPLSEEERRAAKNTFLVLKEREKVARTARVKELKKKALNINSKDRSNKTPASDHQREVLRLVFDQITPYPDEAWISQLALHFNWYVSLILQLLRCY
jgi:hypothetical protein